MTCSETFEVDGLWPMATMEAKTGYHRTTIYGWMRRGKFPPPLKIGGKSRWIADEIREWMKKQVADRTLVGVGRRQWPA